MDPILLFAGFVFYSGVTLLVGCLGFALYRNYCIQWFSDRYDKIKNELHEKDIIFWQDSSTFMYSYHFTLGFNELDLPADHAYCTKQYNKFQTARILRKMNKSHNFTEVLFPLLKKEHHRLQKIKRIKEGKTFRIKG